MPASKFCSWFNYNASEQLSWRIGWWGVYRCLYWWKGKGKARASYAQSAQLDALAVARYFVLSRKQAQNLPPHTHTQK